MLHLGCLCSWHTYHCMPVSKVNLKLPQTLDFCSALMNMLAMAALPDGGTVFAPGDHHLKGKMTLIPSAIVL